jgi:hypothetical protein
MNVSRTTQEYLRRVTVSALLLSAAVVSQGCTAAGPISTTHGDAVRTSMAQQVVNPTPAEPDRMVAGAEGVATAHVVNAYALSFKPEAGKKPPVIFSFGGIK